MVCSQWTVYVIIQKGLLIYTSSFVYEIYVLCKSFEAVWNSSCACCDIKYEQHQGFKQISNATLNSLLPLKGYRPTISRTKTHFHYHTFFCS